ncbi:hypothetical protein D3C78_1555930 [compost metagenome]
MKIREAVSPTQDGIPIAKCPLREVVFAPLSTHVLVDMVYSHTRLVDVDEVLLP